MLPFALAFAFAVTVTARTFNFENEPAQPETEKSKKIKRATYFCANYPDAAGIPMHATVRDQTPLFLQLYHAASGGMMGWAASGYLPGCHS